MSSSATSSGYCLHFILHRPKLTIGVVFFSNILLAFYLVRKDISLMPAAPSSFFGNILFRRSKEDNQTDPQGEKDECWDYRRMAHMDRPKALDLLGNREFIMNERSEMITLVTHLTNDRLDRLTAMMEHWSGPISATIYADESQVVSLLGEIEKSEELISRQDLLLHIVRKEGDLYPVNYLRNIGLNHTVTKYVFPVDVDLIPVHGTHDSLLEHAHKMDRGVLLVPAFQETGEGERIKEKFPRSKSELISLWEQSSVIPFLSGEDQCRKCHFSTDFPRWRNSSISYMARYRRYFEPYVAGRKDKLPAFSELYGGRFKDKISFVEEIYAKGLKFHVVPDLFLLHLWHEHSDQFNRLWNRCSNKAEDIFEQYLKEKYPNAGL